MTAHAFATPVPPPLGRRRPRLAQPRPDELASRHQVAMSLGPARGGQPPASSEVRLIRESFAAVEPHAEDAARYFYAVLFSLAPQVRDLFPINMEVQRTRLLRALVHVVQLVDRPDELAPYLRQLGRDHRKFGVLLADYEAVGIALLGAVRRYAGAAWTPATEQAWAGAYTAVATLMQEAASAEPGPAWWPATVVAHQRLSWDLAVVWVRPDQPVPYRAGQYLSVEVPQRPRLWRYLSPANAPRPDGLIEFHVRAVPGGWASRAIVGHTGVGDQWRLGPPLGRLTAGRGRDVVMIAGGTGIAPLRAILEELAHGGGSSRVHAFYGGRTPDDLYALDALHALAAGNPWLTVVPVAESGAPAGAEHGTLADAVTRHGPWPDHDVLVSGSPAMIRATVAALLAAGTPVDRIRYDPLIVD